MSDEERAPEVAPEVGAEDAPAAAEEAAAPAEKELPVADDAPPAVSSARPHTRTHAPAAERPPRLRPLPLPSVFFSRD